MILDKPITNPGTGSSANPDFLTEMRLLSSENETPLERAEQLLDDARYKRVMRMTAARFAKLPQVERRNYARWAKHFADVFAEKARLFSRNTIPEPELPADLQARG